MAINNIVKICKVHGKLEYKNIRRRTERKGNQLRCIICDKVAKKRYYLKNKEKFLEDCKQYRLKNKEKIKENFKTRKYYLDEKRKEKRREYCKRYSKKIIKELSPAYVRTFLKECNLPMEFIEVKRNQIKLNRKLKEIKREKRTK